MGAIMPLSPELNSIQEAIICLHRDMYDESPSPMKLQKLCYYAQGYYLAEYDRMLFAEGFEAWQHGPVIPSLYHHYKDYRWHPINSQIDIPMLSPDIYSFLQDVVGAYGRYDGAALSTMTHREAPWIVARNGLDDSYGSDAPISNQIMKEFFAAKLNGYV